MVRAHLIRLLAVSVVFLASCGGGRDATQSTDSQAMAVLKAPQTAVVDAALCERAAKLPKSAITYRMVDGQCLHSYTGFDDVLSAPTDQRRKAQATTGTPAAATRVPTITELFDWAEKAYPELFPSHEANRKLGNYTYRYYPKTQNHTAVDGVKVYVQGPLSDGALLYVGDITSFGCTIFPDTCVPTQPKACNPPTSWFAGGNTCTPNADQTAQIASGASFTFTDSTGDTRGTATYTCTDGSLGLKGTASCELRVPAACNTDKLTWTSGANTCVANATEPLQLVSGESHTFLSSGTRVGSASYTCTDGTLKANGTATCEVPPPAKCKQNVVTWTVNGNLCESVDLPTEVAGGGSYQFLDQLGNTTGYATFNCSTTGVLTVSQADAVCVTEAHILDSFGGDGGGADGSANGDGTAGDGAPIVGGQVKIVDINGKTANATTDSRGYFRVKLTGFLPPMVISVTRPDGKVRRSISLLTPKANTYIFMAVTGLTDKIASDVARAAGGSGAAALTPQMVAANPGAIIAAINAIRNDPVLRDLIISAGLNPDTFDPLGMPFRANGAGYDLILDSIVVTVDSTGGTVIQPITCNAPLSWTVGNLTCTPDAGEETTIPSGGSIIHKDSVGPTTGSVGWSCLKGVLQPPVLASCQLGTSNASCSAPGAWTVNGNTCNPDSGAGTTIASGGSLTQSDTQGTTTGTVVWSCVNGGLQQGTSSTCSVSTNASCTVPSSWTVNGSTCIPDAGQATTIVSGGSVSVVDSTGSPTGNAVFTCQNGSVQQGSSSTCQSSTASCTAPSSWTVGSSVCTPDAGQPTTIPAGSTISQVDTRSPTTGSVSYACVNGVVQQTGNPQCQTSTAPTSCTAPSSWTVGNSVCTPDSGQPTTIAAGSSITQSDSGSPTTGSVTYACNNGVTSISGTPLCQTSGASNGCAAPTSWTVGNNVCTPDSGQPTTIPFGQSQTLIDSTQPVTGSGVWFCSASGGAQPSGTPTCQQGQPTIVDMSSGTYTGTTPQEEFRFDFALVHGRVTTATDLAVVINGFDVSKDRLVFVNVTDQTLYTEAQFKALPGVVISENPFNGSTTIAFDPNANNQVGGITLNGILDASLSQIVVETMVRPAGSIRPANSVRRAAAK